MNAALTLITTILTFLSPTPVDASVSDYEPEPVCSMEAQWVETEEDAVEACLDVCGGGWTGDWWSTGVVSICECVDCGV